MILGLLEVVDDLAPGNFESAIARIEKVRGGNRRALDLAVADYAKEVNVQVTTLENYTRLPVGVFKSPQLGWAGSQRVTDLYKVPTEALVLSALGRGDAEWLRGAIDVRESQLREFQLDERAHFANFGYYASWFELASI